MIGEVKGGRSHDIAELQHGLRFSQAAQGHRVKACFVREGLATIAFRQTQSDGRSQSGLDFDEAALNNWDLR